MVFKQIARRIRTEPAFYVFAVLSLGLGIGVSGSAQAIVAALGSGSLLGPRGALVDVVVKADGSQPPDWRATMSLSAYQRLVDSGVARFAASVSSSANIRIGSLNQTVIAEAITPTYFDLLHLSPSAGRRLVPTDEDTPAVVVSSDLAKRLDSELERDVLGQAIAIDGVVCEVVGILPRDFRGLATHTSKTDVWLPIGVAQRAHVVSTSADAKQVTALVEHSERVSSAGILTILQRVGRLASPTASSRGDNLSVMAAEAVDIGGLSLRQQWALVGVASLILAVGVLNLANLSLARSLRREQDIRVKLSLGASWTRLISDEAAESLLVAVIAAGLATIATKLFANTWTSTVPVRQGQLIDVVPKFGPVTVALLAALPILAIIVIGLLPAIRIVRAIKGEHKLAAAGHGVSANVTRPGRNLIRWQVAAVGVLIFIGAAVSGPLRRLADHDTGMRVDELVIAEIDASAVELTERAELAHRVTDGIRHIRGASLATVSFGMPFGVHSPTATVHTSKFGPRSTSGDITNAEVVLVAVGEQYFETTGIALMAGRAITPQDIREQRAVAVISRSIADELFAGSDALGGAIVIDSNGHETMSTIVGITGNTDVVRIGSRNGGTVFVPLTAEDLAFPTVIARGAVDERLLADVRRTVLDADRRVSISAVGTGEQLLAPVLTTLKNAAVITLTCGVAGLLLAMIGLYGVMLQLVEVRNREIGIRLALGATNSDVKVWILAIGLWPVVEGLLISLAVIVSSFIFLSVTRGGGSEYVNDAVASLVITAVMLVAASLLACWVPAARATRVSPRQLLTTP